jgi:fibronectin type 3 domain-containing protein
LKTTTLTRRAGPVLFGALGRAGLAGVTAGLILAGGAAAGTFGPMAPAAFASAASPAQGADQTAPAAPADLAAVAGVGEVTLSWTASDGATSYDVYAGTTDDFQSSTKLITVRGLGYTAAGLTSGTRYYFWVTAANSSGTSSPSSVASTPLELRGTAPGAPVRLAATAGQGQITLSWTAPASSGVSPVTGYDIYVGSTQAFRGGQPQFVSQGPGTSYVVKGLSGGATYYFKVAAVSAQGSGPASEVASATVEPQPTAPGAPGNVIAQPGRSRVIVMWTAPATTGGAKVSGYLVYAGTRPGGESSTPVSPALIHDTATAVMGLSSSTKYYFKVAAVDSTGQRGALSAEVSAIPWPAVGSGPVGGSPSPTVSHPAGQPTSPVQASPTGQPNPAPPSQTADPAQDQSSPGTPTGLIILLAAVALAALTGAVALAVRHRRTRIRPGTPGAFQPGERDSRPDAMSGPRYR